MRENCSRFAFDGCRGDGGETCRGCPGKFQDINAMIIAESRQTSADFWNLATAFFVGLALTWGALSAVQILVKQGYENNKTYRSAHAPV